jgi:hypothetical protein
MDELTKKIAELADKFGPHTIESVREAAHYTCLNNIIGGAIGTSLSLAILAIIAFCWWKFLQKENYLGCSHLLEVMLLITLIIGGVAVLMFLISTAELLDFWTYACLSNPDAFIAHKVTGI